MRRRIGVILSLVVVFTGITVAYSLGQPSVYEAASKVLLQGTIAEQIVGGGQANTLGLDPNDSGDTEIQVMQSPEVVDAVARRLGHRPTVSITRVRSSTIVLVRARAGTRAGAVRDATTFAHVYVDVRKQQQLDQLVEVSNQFQTRIAELDNRLVNLQAPLRQIDTQIAGSVQPDERVRLQAQREALVQQMATEASSITNRRTTYADQLDRLQLAVSATVSGGAQVVADAVARSTPVEPRPLQNGVIALGLSALLGIALALLFEQLDDTIRSKTQLEQLTGLVTIGLIPSVKNWRKGKAHEVVLAGAETSSAAEAYRSLRTAVQFIGVDRPAQVIQITSALPSEGKTTTAANLGLSLARGGKRVVLVDADLRRPRLHELFDLSSERGLTSVLLREISLSDAVQPVPGERQLALLASGNVPPNPVELLTVANYTDIISTLRTETDYVIIDTPPVLPVADARIVSAHVDITLMVVAANASAEKHIKRSLEILEQVNARVAGTILNNIPGRGRHSLSYGYWYSYGAPPRPKARRRDKHREAPKPARAEINA